MWISKIIGYDFTVKYKVEKENLVAYALSKKLRRTWVGEL